MSIIIKGMEMPTTCCNCKLICFDETRKWEQMTGAFVCQMTDKVIWNTRRGDDCPLVELPPHGRLIDADALADDLLFDVDLCEKALFELVGQERKNVQDEKDTKQNCVYWIQNAPTIIEAEGSGT